MGVDNTVSVAYLLYELTVCFIEWTPNNCIPWDVFEDRCNSIGRCIAFIVSTLGVKDRVAVQGLYKVGNNTGLLVFDTGQKRSYVLVSYITPMSELQLVQQIQEISADSVVLPQSVVENLNTWQVRTMKETVATVQSGTIVVGHTLRVMSKSLHQLKSLVPRGNWTKFCQSDIVPLNSRQIMDMVKAWEGFLSKSELTDGELSTISARSLARLASADTKTKKEVTKRLKAGEKVTLKDIDRIRNSISDIVEEAVDEDWGQKMTDLQVIATDVVTNNERFRDENTALERKVERLEAENAKLRKQVADLKAELADMPIIPKGRKMETVVSK